MLSNIRGIPSQASLKVLQSSRTGNRSDTSGNARAILHFVRSQFHPGNRTRHLELPIHSTCHDFTRHSPFLAPIVLAGTATGGRPQTMERNEQAWAAHKNCSFSDPSLKAGDH